MKPYMLLESLLLLLAVALLTPIPTSNGEHYAAFPLVYLSVLLFLASRLIRHVGPLPSGTNKAPSFIATIAETVVYGVLVFVIRQAAFLA